MLFGLFYKPWVTLANKETGDVDDKCDEEDGARNFGNPFYHRAFWLIL